MPVKRCRYDAVTEEVHVDGGGSFWIGEDGDLIGSSEAIGDCSLVALRNTLATVSSGEAGVTIYDATERELRIDEEAFVAVADFTFLHQSVQGTTALQTERNQRFDRQELAVRLSAALGRNRLRIHALQSHDDPLCATHWLTLEVLGRGRTINDATNALEEVQALWIATAGGSLDSEAVVDFLRAHRPELLIGTAESAWLEVKRAGYALERPDQQFELAKDVAAMANTEHGGLLVVGLATTKEGGRDVIRAYHPVDPKTIEPRKYRKIIESRLYPRPQALTIERIETAPGEALLLIAIPQQPTENHPVLVRGALAEGATLGHHIGLFRREGDKTVWTDPTALHSLIAAGRAALAKGLPPTAAGDPSQDAGKR